MFELIALLITAGTAVGGYIQTRRFVRRRLGYVDAIQKPAAPVVAGGAAALVALPLVWILPLVGAGTAMVFGASVGMGVAAGVRDVRKRLPGY